MAIPGYALAAAIAALAAVLVKFTLDSAFGDTLLRLAAGPGLGAALHTMLYRAAGLVVALIWIVLLVWAFHRASRPAHAVERACRAGLFASALFPLSVVTHIALDTVLWAQPTEALSLLPQAVVASFALLVFNPALCVGHLLADRALGLPRPSPLALRLVTTYATLIWLLSWRGITPWPTGARDPVTVVGVALVVALFTVAGLVLMVWPGGPFALRAAVVLAGLYAGNSPPFLFLLAPVVTFILWSRLHHGPG